MDVEDEDKMEDNKRGRWGEKKLVPVKKGFITMGIIYFGWNESSKNYHLLIFIFFKKK